MDIRSKTQKALIELTVSANTKGFDYITEAIELISGNEDLKYHVYTIYSLIAENHQVSVGSVERAIRHAFQETCKRGPLNAVEKWLTTTGKQNNGNLLSLLYVRVKAEGK